MTRTSERPALKKRVLGTPKEGPIAGRKRKKTKATTPDSGVHRRKKKDDPSGTSKSDPTNRGVSDLRLFEGGAQQQQQQRVVPPESHSFARAADDSVGTSKLDPTNHGVSDLRLFEGGAQQQQQQRVVPPESRSFARAAVAALADRLKREPAGELAASFGAAAASAAAGPRPCRFDEVFSAVVFLYSVPPCEEQFTTDADLFGDGLFWGGAAVMSALGTLDAYRAGSLAGWFRDVFATDPEGEPLRARGKGPYAAAAGGGRRPKKAGAAALHDRYRRVNTFLENAAHARELSEILRVMFLATLPKEESAYVPPSSPQPPAKLPLAAFTPAWLSHVESPAEPA
ncbi:hypothetical protein DIPPA_31843 [Diplonema papillatum]|nr:hypothetical protein DIPPA_31843 [Diplonema papillatum]